MLSQKLLHKMQVKVSQVSHEPLDQCHELDLKDPYENVYLLPIKR